MGDGTKYDTGKPDMALMPHAALVEIAKVFTFGATKYAPDNWRSGFLWRRVLSALERHLAAWSDGEDDDEETGFSHLAHAGCNLLFLLEFGLKGLGTDDRWRQPCGCGETGLCACNTAASSLPYGVAAAIN